MGKKSKLTLLIAFGLVGLIYVVFLFALPSLISLDSFKSKIIKNIAAETGLKVDYEGLKLTTHYNLSVGAVIENSEVLTPEGKKILSIKQASVKIPLFPLIFRKLEIADVKVNSPEVYLTRLASGKFDVEQLLKESAEVDSAPNQETFSQGQEAAAPSVEPVFNGLNALITNYKVNLTDKSLSKETKFVLKGDFIELFDFNPEKYLKLKAKGQFLIENNPNINFDIVVASELPLVEEIKQQSEAVKTVNAVKQPATTEINPLEGLLKYNFKGDIVADLRLKRGDKLPVINGFFEFDKLSLKINNKKLPDSSGKLKFFGKKFDINSKLFITPVSFVEIVGKVNNIAKQDYDINVKTSDILLSDVKNFAYSLADAVGADTQALKEIDLGGKLKADFNIRKKDCRGYLQISEAKVTHKGISKTLNNINVSLKFDNDKVVFQNTTGLLGDIKFDITGNVTSSMDADLKINIPTVNTATLFNIANNSNLLADLKPQLKDIKAVSGNLSVSAVIKGNLNDEIKPLLTINNFNTKILLKDAPMPIKLTGGEVVVDTNDVNINNLQVSALSQPLKISGKIYSYEKDCKLDLIVNGKVLAADIKKYAPADIQKNLKLGQELPLAAKITGTPENIDLTAQINLNNFAYIVELDQPQNISNILNINMNIKPTSLYFSNSGLFAGSNIPKDKSGIYKLASTSKKLSVKGFINSYNTKPFLHNIKIDISDLNLKLAEPKGKLQLNGNFVVEGKAVSPKATGTLNAKNIDIPSMLFKADNINVAFKDKEILVNTGVLSLSDSKVIISAALKNKLSPPFIINSMEINSDFLNIDKISAAFQPSVPAKTSPDRNSGGAARPASAKTAQPDVPLIITGGKFSAKKLVISNLLNEDLSFNFTINPLNVLKINEFITRVGGGTATGVIDMNLKTTKLNLDCAADNVEINALASTLAQTPNEIYGAMKGRIKLTTMGSAPEAMVQNAVGRVDFNVVNGHLPKLGSIKYLLGAKNLLGKGITNSLLSNTLNFEEAEKTNHFDTLNGLVLINRGVLDIQDISMQGKYLSSFISGSLQMKDNNADITVLSKLSGKVVRQLGPIADFSLDKLIRQLPGEWGQLLADQRIINQYPNRDRIPALTTDSLPEEKDFAVKIRGNLNKPYAVRMFEWLP